MSEENNTLGNLNTTPSQDSYDTSISNTENTGGGEQETNESPLAFDTEIDMFGDNPGVVGFAEGLRFEGAVSGDTLDRLDGYTQNVTNLDQAFADAAITQGVWGALSHGLARGVTEIVGGTVEGFGALAAIFDDERMMHENMLEEFGRNIRESTNELEIWERNQGATFQFGDAAWWAKNIPSIASTIAMMIPAAGVARGVSLLGKAAKASRLAKTAKAAKVIARTEDAVRSVAGGVSMRHVENMREAHQTFEEARSEVLRSGAPLSSFEDTDAYVAFNKEHNRRPASLEELADYVGGSAAQKSYNFNSMNLLFDIAQFHGIGRVFKATRGMGNAAAKAAAKGADKVSKATRRYNRAKKAGILFAEAGSEGVEEMVNFVGGKEGLHHGMMMAGLGKESTFDERLKMYQNDGHMWEGAFFGAIGGAVFTGARPVMDRISGKGTKQQERIMQQTRQRAEVSAKAQEIAKKVDSGELSADQGRAEVAHLQMEQAFTAANEGTADLFEDQINHALEQMEKEGVSQEQRDQFQEDSLAALETAEAAVKEARLIAAGIDNLSPQARTMLTHTLGTIAHDQYMNLRHRESLAPRIEQDADFEGKRAAAIREAIEDMQKVKAAADNDGARQEAQESIDNLTKLAEGLPDVEMVVDEAKVAKLESKVEELESKDPTSMEPAAKKALAKELADTKAELVEAKKGEPKKYDTSDPLVVEYIGTELQELELNGLKQAALSAKGIESLKKNAEILTEALKKKEEEARKSGQETRTDEELKAERKRLTEEDDADRIAEIDRELEQRKLRKQNANQSKLEQRSKDIQVSPVAQAAIDKLIADTENLELVGMDSNSRKSYEERLAQINDTLENAELEKGVFGDETLRPRLEAEKAAIEERLANDNKYYEDKRTGKLYMRTTTFIHQGKGKDIKRHWSVPSTNIGNSVDLFVRDYFDGNIGQNEYPHLSVELQAKLKEELVALEEQFVANGEKVVPHDVTLMADTDVAAQFDSNVAGVAGTVDLLTVDKDGNLRVYDMKTVREAQVVKTVWKDGQPTSDKAAKIINDPNFEGEFSLWGKRMDPESVRGYQAQVSTYAIMAEMSTGLPVVEAGIIPIDTRYETSEKLSEEELQAITADSVELLPVITQTLIPNINGLEVPATQEMDSTEPDNVKEPADENVEPSDDATPPDPDKDRTLQKPESIEDEIDFMRGRVKALDEQITLKSQQLETARQRVVDAIAKKNVVSEGAFSIEVDRLRDEVKQLKEFRTEFRKEIEALEAKLDENYLQNNQQDAPVVNEDDVVPGDDTSIVETPVAETPFTIPVGALVSYFADKLKVTTDWNRDNMLAHGHDGAFVIGDPQNEAIYTALQDALRPNSSAVIKFEVREADKAAESVKFKQMLRDKNMGGRVSNLPGVAATDKKGFYTYTPSLADSMVIAVTINGVEVGLLPNTGELLLASSKRFDSVSTSKRIADNTWGKETRAGRKVSSEENLAMSEQSQEAHLENALAINELRNAIYNVRKANPNAPIKVRAEVTAGKTTMGLTAVGSPILDLSRELTAESLGVGDLLRTEGVAIALPNNDGTTQKIQRMGATKEAVTPYGQNEEVGATSVSQGRYSSGGLFVPVQQPGQPQPMWLKVPGQTVRELVRGEEIGNALAELVRAGDDASISIAQNILGSRSLSYRVDENGDRIPGSIVIYPTNQIGELMAGVTPLTERINGVWTVDPGEVIPGMKVDIAVQLDEGESAFRSAGELDLAPLDQDGAFLYDNLGDFVAKEMRLGYAPVTNTRGSILGWTHPMAPAYARNDSNPTNNEAYKGKVLYNENANRTQMRLGATPIAVEGVSGAELMAKMTDTEASEVKTDALKKQAKEEAKQAKTPEKKKVAEQRVQQLDLFGPPTPSSNESGKVTTEGPTIEELKKQLKTLKNQIVAFNTEDNYKRIPKLKEKAKALEAQIEAEAKKTAMEWGLTEEQQAMRDKLEASKRKRRRWMDVAAQEAIQNAEKNTEIDMKIADGWWSENMPNVPFKRVKGIITRHGKVGYGLFEEGAVTISDLGVKGIEYHEAFHVVFDMYLTPERQARLLGEAATKYGLQLNEEQLEEELADAFREYMLTDGLSNREKSAIRRFFSELLELIKALAKDGFGGARRMYLFQGINSGKFNGDARTAGTAQRWMKADLPVWATNEVHREELNGVIKRFAFEAWRDRDIYGNSETLDRILNGSEAEAMENLGEPKFQAAARELVTMAFDGSLAFGFADARAGMDPTSAAYENSGRLMTEEREQVIEAMAKDRKFQAWVKDLTAGTETAGTDQTSQYSDEAFAKMNPKDSLSANVRNLIENTPQVTAATLRNSAELKNLMATAQMLTQNAAAAKKEENTTEYENILDNINEISTRISDLIGSTPTSSIFGLPRGMNLDLNFPFMSSQLSSLDSPQAMINRLFELGKAYPELSMLAIRLANEPADVQGQFFNGFKRTTSNEVQIKRGKAIESSPFDRTLSFQNQSNLARTLADINTSDVLAKLDKLKSLMPTLEEDVQVSQTLKALDMIGFNTIDPAARQVVVENIAAGSQGSRALVGLVGAAQTAVKAYQTMHNAKDDAAHNVAQRGFNDAVNILANQFSHMDRGAVQTQLENVEGTRVQDKQVPSFIGRWYDSLNQRPAESNEAYEARIRKMFKDPRFKHTNHYHLMFGKGDKFRGAAAGRKARALRLGGYTTGDGKNYTSMTNTERMAFQLTAMQGVRDIGPMFQITTPSDAGGSYMVPGQVYDPTSEAGRVKTLRALEGVVESELMWLQAPGRKGRFSNPKVDAYMRTQFAGSEGDFWSIDTTAKNKEAIAKAAEILLEDLLAEAEVLREHPDFTGAIDAGLINEKVVGQQEMFKLPIKLAVSGFMANWSHSTVLAGTHNEFKQNIKKNTTDMQKRHKHVVSPTITPSGVSPKTEFTSVTLKDVPRDLTDPKKGGTPSLGAWSQYKKVEVADAQTWVTPDMYEAILIESGDWNPTYGEAFEILRQGGTLPTHLHNKLMRPFKPFYYNRTFNGDIGMMESHQIKNSIIPLIPGISPQFDALGQWMKDNEIDQVQMGTANKVGNNRGEVELVNDNGEFEVIAYNEDNKHVLPMSGYGKQVHNPDHWHNDSTNTLMSQMQRISAAAAVSFMGEEGIAIANEFADTLEQIYKEQYTEFMDQFNDDAGDFSNVKFGDWLLNELADSDLPQSTLDLIKEGKFTAPQVAPLMRGRVYSAVENSAKNVRVAGGTAVQISSQFYKNRDQRLKGQRLGKSGAKTVTKTVKGTANNRTMMEDLLSAARPGEFAVVVSEGETRPLTVEDLELGVFDNTLVIEHTTTNGLGKQSTSIANVDGVTTILFRRRIEQFAKENGYERTDVIDALDYDGMIQEIKDDEQLSKEDPDFVSEPSMPTLKAYAESLGADQEVTVEEGGETVVLPAEIAISRDFLPKKYQNKEKYPDVESIRAEAPEVLELFTVRIPSESPNSGSLCTVVEFLPDTMDGVIVPDEFVTQMGSDFDVDKLFFIWKDHTGKNELMNKLYDGMTAPFRDPRVLPAIQAPQGFDTLSALAEQKGLREESLNDHINKNPYSVLTHHMLTADNMAGVALKGQAANKNLILLDSIANQMTVDTRFNFRSVPARFGWKPGKSTEEIKGLHSEMVAAAMDGAKDPVYGKLGVTNDNFNLFSTIILMGGGIPSYETYTDDDGTTHNIPGGVSFAVEVVQSEPARMEAEGHISIRGSENETTIVGKTAKGFKFVQQLAKQANKKVVAQGATEAVTVPARMTLDPRSASTWEMASALGQFKTHIVQPLKKQGDAMRVDRKSIRNAIEDAAMTSADTYSSETFVTEKSAISELSYVGKNGQRVQNPFDARVKGQVRGIFDGTVDLLTKVGDGYLNLLRSSTTSMAKALSSGAYDSFVAARAAENMGAEAESYKAMGERTTREVESLPENNMEWSLEMWERHLKRQPETASDPDMQLVLSKILPQPKPYQFSNGNFADNLTLTGISDDMERLEVQKAVQRIYDRGGDGKLFIEAMTVYEAQRSRFNMSQGRFTSILPSQVHSIIAAEADVSEISDGVLSAGTTSTDSTIAAILQNQIYNADKLPFGGEFENVADALDALEEFPQAGPRRFVVGGVTHVGLPEISIDEDNKEAVIYSAFKPDSANVAGDVQNFAGHMFSFSRDAVAVDRSTFARAKSRAEKQLGEGVIPEGVTTVDQLNAFMRGEAFRRSNTNQSRLEYGKDLRPQEKIEFLKNRFAKAGVPVRVEMDVNLGANAEVRIENGSAIITINPNLLQGDTIAHEFGHILIEGLGYNHPVVQQLIQELRGTDIWNEVALAYGDIQNDTKKFEKEVVVTALGRAASKQMEQGKLRTLLNKLFRAIGKMFGIKPKATQQLVDMLLAEGPIPAFNLAEVSTVEEQRSRKTGTDVTKEFEQKWSNLAQQLQTRKFTNTQFEVAAARLTREQIRVTKAKTIGTKLERIADAAQSEVRAAAGITARLKDVATGGFTGTKMSAEEVRILADVHTTLQSLETLRSVLNGMDPEGADANSKIREQYLALQEELDRLLRAETILKEELAAVISQQLAAVSTDPAIKKFVEEEGNLIFDMINDPELRERMTDVTALEKGTLGISEFKNPVIQLIAKQVATAVEAGRLEGRSAEMRVSDILQAAKAKGVTINELIDKSTGKFITEQTAEYAEGNRKARIAAAAGNEGEYLKFHAANSSMPMRSEYVKEYMFGTIDLRKKLAQVEELRNAKKTFGMNSLDGAIAQAEAELKVLLEKRAPLIRKFHTIEVGETFEAAREKEAEKGEEALIAFDNEHGVVDGVPMNENSRFVTIKPIEAYVNNEYVGDGSPQPTAKNRNPKYAKLSNEARETLKQINEELKAAMGADSKFIEEGSVPFYKVKDEQVDWRTRIKQAREKAEKGIKDIKDPNKEQMAERVLEDAGGRSIYTRQRKVYAASPEQVASFESLDDLAKHLGEAVKDAHKESAKASMEPFAYLSRDVFDGTEVIDGKHAILVGKKGERTRQLRSREVAGTNISVALDQWLEGMLGENWEDASSLDAPVAAFQQYTSLMGVGINLPAWFNNFAYGNVQRWLEVRGGEFYDKEHAKRARQVIGADIMGITNDIISGKRSDYGSPVSAMINLLDIADDQRELPFGKRETMNSKIINALYVGQTMGEVIMQNHTAFAIMMDTKVVLADGTETNLYDAMSNTFNSESGTVKLPEGAKVMYQNEMVDLDANYLALFRNRAKAINHYIHGAYNKQDAGTWQREAWGRALMQFRRWLPMNMKKRFASKQYNERRERTEEGWYRSMLQFLGIVINNARDMQKMKNAIQSMKEDSPAQYKGAMNAMIEVGSGLGMFMLLALIYAGLDEDDEDNWLIAMGLNRSQRLMQEMNTYTPWGLIDTFGSMAENPFAAITRVEGLGKVLGQIIEDGAGFAFKGTGLEIYKSGQYKGSSKLGVAMGKSVPGISHGMRLLGIADVQKQYSSAKNLADWFAE